MKYILYNATPPGPAKLLDVVELPSLDEAKAKADSLPCTFIEEEDGEGKLLNCFCKADGVWKPWNIVDQPVINII
jgi:hypothetical protein